MFSRPSISQFPLKLPFDSGFSFQFFQEFFFFQFSPLIFTLAAGYLHPSLFYSLFSLLTTSRLLLLSHSHDPLSLSLPQPASLTLTNSTSGRHQHTTVTTAVDNHQATGTLPPILSWRVGKRGASLAPHEHKSYKFIFFKCANYVFGLRIQVCKL